VCFCLFVVVFFFLLFFFGFFFVKNQTHMCFPSTPLQSRPPRWLQMLPLKSNKQLSHSWVLLAPRNSPRQLTMRRIGGEKRGDEKERGKRAKKWKNCWRGTNMLWCPSRPRTHQSIELQRLHCCFWWIHPCPSPRNAYDRVQTAKKRLAVTLLLEGDSSFSKTISLVRDFSRLDVQMAIASGTGDMIHQAGQAWHRASLL